MSKVMKRVRVRRIEKNMDSESVKNWEDLRKKTGLDIIKSERGLSGPITNDTYMYLPITKMDEESRMVYGTITKEGLDNQDEIVEYEATKKALPDFMKWRNLREMHQPKAVGTIPEITCDDVHKLVNVGAHVVDDGAWEKCKQGVYKGFSIGGKALSRVKEFSSDLNKTISRVKEYMLNEVSLVDRPAHPECIFTMVKRDEIFDPLMKDIELSTSKLDNLRKKILKREDISELPDEKFALVRRLKKRDGTIEVQRFLPIPDKAHAHAVMKQIMGYDINKKERAIMHKNVRHVLGKSHRPNECPYCTPLYYELAKRGGDTLMNKREKLLKARRTLDSMLEDLEGAIDVDDEEVVDSEAQDEADHESYSHDKSEFEGSSYDDVEGSEDDDEGVEEYGDTSDGLGSDEENTRLWDTDQEKEDKASSPDSEDDAGEDAEGADVCPYCGITLKLLTEQGLSKAQCPGCSAIYGIEETPQVTFRKSGGIRKSAGTNSRLEKAFEQMVELNEELVSTNEQLIKRLERLEKRGPRKTHRVDRPGTDEDVNKADTSLEVDMKKALDLKKMSDNGQVLTPEQKQFIDNTVNKSLDSKIS